MMIVDEQIAGDIKMVGDIDNDGFADLVIGGVPAEKLNWYRFPDWRKTIIATPESQFTTDGELGDIDGDGDLDIIVPDGDGTNNLVWFENPLPRGMPIEGRQWRRHVVGSIGGYGKDVELADFDDDGRLDIAARSKWRAMLFFQEEAYIWHRIVLPIARLGEEGMASGDIDGNGAVDLVLRGVWVKNPGGALARVGGEWIGHRIGPAPLRFKALVADLNSDGMADVVFSSSEDTAPVRWWTPANGNPAGRWRDHVIIASLEKAHTLQACDINRDGDLDLMLGQMHTSEEKQLAAFYNLNGTGTTWKRQLIDSAGIHNGVAADIGGDGDCDIFGSNWTGNPPVRVWINRSVPRQSQAPKPPINRRTPGRGPLTGD